MMKDPKILAGIAILVLAAGWFYVKPNFIDAKAVPVYTQAELADAPQPVLQLGERVLNLPTPAGAPPALPENRCGAGIQ